MKFVKKVKGWVVIGLCLSAITAILTSVPAYVAMAEQNLKQPSLLIQVFAPLGTFIFVLIAGPLTEQFITKKQSKNLKKVIKKGCEKK